MKARQAQADLQRVQREKDALASENERLKPTATATEPNAVRPVPAELVEKETPARPALGGLPEKDNTGGGRPATMSGQPEKENSGPLLGRPAASVPKKENSGPPLLGRPAASLPKPVATAYPPRIGPTSSTALPAATVRRPSAASAASAQPAEGSPECSQQ